MNRIAPFAVPARRSATETWADDGQMRVFVRPLAVSGLSAIMYEKAREGRANGHQ